MGLRIKILLPLLFLSALLLVFLYGYWMPRSLANMEDEHRVSVERHVESVAEAMVPLLLARQLDTVYENLDALGKRNTDWVSMQLFDDKGRMIYPLKKLPSALQGGSVKDVHTIERQIDYLDMHLGKLIVSVDFAPKLSAIKRRHVELIALMLMIIAGYILTIGFILDRAVRRPVNLLAHASERLAEGDFSATLPKTGDDEVGTLVNSFRSMRDTIRNYQAELKMASSYNRSLIEASLDPLVTIDAGGKITDVNAATEKVTGHTREELIGTDFSDYFTEPDKARAGYQQVFREGTVRDYALEIRHRDGHVTPVLYNASVYRNQAGDVIGMFAAARDITERKRAEEALRKSEERLRLEMTRMPIGYIVWDKDFRVVTWNPAAEKIFGFTFDEAKGWHPYEIIVPPEVQPQVDDIWRRLLAGDASAHSVNENLTKDGRTITCEWTNTPLKQPDGTVLGVMSMVQDITERVQAEEALRQSEERFRRLAENARDVIYRMSLPDGKYEYISPAALSVFGYSQEDFYEHPILIKQAIHPDWHKYFEEQWANLVKGEMPPTYEYQIIHKSGEVRWLNQRNILVRDNNGSPTAIEGIVTDITERKRAEDEIRKLNEELEQRVKQKTAELEAKIEELQKMNRLFVGRELRMIELKEKIRELEKER